MLIIFKSWWYNRILWCFLSFHYTKTNLPSLLSQHFWHACHCLVFPVSLDVIVYFEDCGEWIGRFVLHGYLRIKVSDLNPTKIDGFLGRRSPEHKSPPRRNIRSWASSLRFQIVKRSWCDTMSSGGDFAVARTSN